MFINMNFEALAVNRPPVNIGKMSNFHRNQGNN
jgi:hypothetical protein